MRLSKPRVPPVDPEALQGEPREIIDRARTSGRTLNIFATLIHHPKLLKRWQVFGNAAVVLNGEVRDAAPGVEYVGTDKRLGGTNVEAGRAAAAVLVGLGGIRGERNVRVDLAEEKPGSRALVD